MDGCVRGVRRQLGGSPFANCDAEVASAENIERALKLAMEEPDKDIASGFFFWCNLCKFNPIFRRASPLQQIDLPRALDAECENHRRQKASA